MRQDRHPCCGIQCTPGRRTFPRPAKKTGVRCTNQAPFEHGGETQAAYRRSRESWRIGTTEGMAILACC